jgi:hypothetical protein
MIVLRTLVLAAVAALAVLAVKRTLGELAAARARAKTPRQPEPRPAKLHQDPRTGVYYPDA